jgi:hypothetical protein
MPSACSIATKLGASPLRLAAFTASEIAAPVAAPATNKTST